MKLEISTGDFLDKLSILELKKELIKDEKKLAQIINEINEYSLEYKDKNIFFYNILKEINRKIWVKTDIIKLMIVSDPNYAQLAYDIFEHNQERFRVKKILNFNSKIKEQKSYAETKLVLVLNWDFFYNNINQINQTFVKYDQVIFKTNNPRLKGNLEKIYPFAEIEKTESETSESKNEILQIEKDEIFDFPTLKYISGGLLGDFFHQLSVPCEYFFKTGRKSELFISNIGDRFNLGLEKAYSDLKYIVEKQIYIKNFKIHNNEQNLINLSSWRNSPMLFKTSWNNLFSSEYSINWGANPWINIEKNKKYEDLILVSSKENQIDNLDINLIKSLGKKMLFVNLNLSECQKCSHKLNLEYEYFEKIEDLAIAINSCYLFVGTLTSPLAISLSMHKKCLACIGYSNDTVHMAADVHPNYSFFIRQNGVVNNNKFLI